MASINRKRRKVSTPDQLKVQFRSLEDPKEADFCLELPQSKSVSSRSKVLSYDDVTKGVANYLGVDDSSKVRLTYHSCDPRQPESEPITYKDEINSTGYYLYDKTFLILYYEVLDTPLLDMQGLKALNVTFHYATKDEVLVRSVTLSIHSTVGDLINDLKTKVQLSHPNAELRLVGVYERSIRTIFPLSEKIEKLSKRFLTLRAEEIPEEEKNLGPLDYLIHFHHYIRDVSHTQWFQLHPQSFYEPFVLRINEGESLAEVKVRIQKKLQAPDDEFSKWKFKRWTFCRSHEYLQDSDIVSSRLRQSGENICVEHFHGDSAQRRTDAANQKRLRTEQEENEHKNEKAEEEAVAFNAAPTSSSEYPGTGQLYEERRYFQGVLDEKFEDIGGFSVLKSQAALYKQIWLKYGHIASSHVLIASYSAQVFAVSDIMKSVMDMHQRCLSEVSSLMIDWWDNKIKMAEQLKFNIRWLRECLEDVKNDFDEKRKLRTSVSEQYKDLEAARSLVVAAKLELKKAKEELTKAQNNVLAMESKINPLSSEEEKFEREKGKRVQFHRLL